MFGSLEHNPFTRQKSLSRRITSKQRRTNVGTTLFYGCVPARVALKFTVMVQCCLFKTNAAFSLSLFLINIVFLFT